jgi:hypothetical protein
MSDTLQLDDWKTLYAAAMLEDDDKQVRHRIDTADAVIRARLQQLPETSSSHSEQAELQSALGNLCRLKNILPAR